VGLQLFLEHPDQPRGVRRPADGHGPREYAAGGVDRRDTISCPFTDPEQVLAFDPIEAFGRQDHAARLRHIAGTRWGLRKYMRMDSLREMDTAAGVAAAMAS